MSELESNSGQCPRTSVLRVKRSGTIDGRGVDEPHERFILRLGARLWGGLLSPSDDRGELRFRKPLVSEIRGIVPFLESLILLL